MCTSCFCLDRPVKAPLHIVEEPMSSSLPVPFRSSGQQIPIRHIALGFVRKSFRAVRMRGESERVAPLVLPLGALRQKNRPRLSQRGRYARIGLGVGPVATPPATYARAFPRSRVRGSGDAGRSSRAARAYLASYGKMPLEICRKGVFCGSRARTASRFAPSE